MIFSKTELEQLNQEMEEPGRPASPNSIANKVIPLILAATRKPVTYTLDDPRPQPEPEKTPAAAAKPAVAAPVPVKKKKVIITDMNTGIRKIEYR